MVKTNPIRCCKLFMAVLIVASASLVGCNMAQVADSNSGQADGAQGETVRIGEIDWYVDYDAAMKVAKESNKPIWLHFGENPG